MRNLVSALLLLSGAAAPLCAQSATLTFTDQTAAAGISSTYTPGSFNSSEYIAPGACGDFDADGDEDLFLPSGGGANGPDKLYINRGDGTFENRSVQWGLTTVHRGLAVAVGDYDDDGYLDLFHASNGVSGSPQSGQNKLYRNVGGQAFTNMAATAGLTGAAVDSFGASFGDYDIDGKLDIFVTGFNTHTNRLYRNNGNGTFTDKTSASQIPAAISSVFGFATRFCDMNGDHYPELLISGDFGTSRYLRNNGNGTFFNYTFQSGTGKDENGMGGCVGDWNRDGLTDWYVTSILSTQLTSWTGNKLYKNTGSHIFTEGAQAAGVKDGGYGWGTVGVDFNHDRWLDIAETNGSTFDPEFINERSYLWLNNGDGTFTESSQAAGFNHFGQGRGLLNFDYDLDGDEDFVLVANAAPVTLWRNDLSGTGIHWLRVRLDTSLAPTLAPNGYGAVVRVTAGGIQQTVAVTGGDNLQSQSELAAHFGLGAETVASEVRVEWNDGTVTVLNNVALDQHLTIQAKPTWANIGYGLAGTSGIPSLVGTGTLEPASAGSLALTSAKPSSLALLFVSLASIPSPFKGGTLATVPVLLSINLATDPAGAMTLPWSWPAGIPQGTFLYFQYAVQDALGPQGASLSNGVRAITP